MYSQSFHDFRIHNLHKNIDYAGVEHFKLLLLNLKSWRKAKNNKSHQARFRPVPKIEATLNSLDTP